MKNLKIIKIEILKIICAWMIKFIDRHASDLLVGYISDRANTVAIVIAMKILDQEGIAHCRVCPARFEMKKTPEGYFCGRHCKDQNSQPRMPTPQPRA